MHPLFQADEGGSTPTSALDLQIDKISFSRAIEFNRRWHSILPRFGTGFIHNQPFPCFAATCGGIIFAVAIWSNPAARNLPQHTWLELRRMAISDDAPRNSASRMLRVMRLMLRRDWPKIVRVYSYQSKSVHTGAMYRADGWQPAGISKGDTWNRPGRARPAAQQIDDRIRWERPICGPPDSARVAETNRPC